ncbi:hypothetical protein DBV15_03346, partial [Temnothorax longispinosus]
MRSISRHHYLSFDKFIPLNPAGQMIDKLSVSKIRSSNLNIQVYLPSSYQSRVPHCDTFLWGMFTSQVFLIHPIRDISSIRSKSNDYSAHEESPSLSCGTHNLRKDEWITVNRNRDCADEFIAEKARWFRKERKKGKHVPKIRMQTLSARFLKLHAQKHVRNNEREFGPAIITTNTRANILKNRADS